MTPVKEFDAAFLQAAFSMDPTITVGSSIEGIDWGGGPDPWPDPSRDENPPPEVDTPPPAVDNKAAADRIEKLFEKNWSVNDIEEWTKIEYKNMSLIGSEGEDEIQIFGDGLFEKLISMRYSGSLEFRTVDTFEVHVAEEKSEIALYLPTTMTVQRETNEHVRLFKLAELDWFLGDKLFHENYEEMKLNDGIHKAYAPTDTETENLKYQLFLTYKRANQQ